MRQVSIGTKIVQLEGLTDTRDVTLKENEFIKNMVKRTNGGRQTAALTSAQIEWIEDLYQKHFA